MNNKVSGDYSCQQWREICKRYNQINYRPDNTFRIVKKFTLSKTQEEAISELEKQKIPCSQVKTIENVRDHSQLKARKSLNTDFDFSKYNVQKATMPNPIIRYSKTPGELVTSAPELGVHTKKILCELLGYKEQDMKKLEEQEIL